MHDKPLTSKQIKRMEKKKKKIAAFLEIAKLNDNDKARAAGQHNQRNHEPMDVEDSQDKPSSLDGPCRKRHINIVNSQHGDSNDKQGEAPVIEPMNPGERPMDVKGFGSGEHINGAQNSCFEPKIPIGNKEYISDEESCSPTIKKKKICDTYAELKNEMRERRSRSQNMPSLRLKTLGELASLNMNEATRTPLLLNDIQELLMYALLGQQAPVWPLRWCNMEKYSRLSHIVVFLIEGVSLHDFVSHSSSFQFLNSTMENKLEVVMPSSYNGSLVEELISVPLTGICKGRLIQRYGSLEAAARACGDVYKTLRAFFPIRSSDNEEDPSLPSSDRFSRTKLLLSPSQLMEEDYPVPVKGQLQDRYSDFVLTKDYYENVTSVSPMFGLDCEMCMTTSGKLEVTRISVVNENLEVVYESYVKPHNRITDYLTRYSGITRKSLSDVSVRLEDVQKELRRLLPHDAILVGQSLNKDLQSLKMMHPFVIDTSVIYNLTGERRRKSKLSMLSHKFLLEDIQNDSNGHCPAEDSRASIKLVQLKLANGIEYGDAVLQGRRAAEQKRERNRLNAEQKLERKRLNAELEFHEEFASSIFTHTQRVQKEAAVVTLPERMCDYNNCISNADGDHNGSKNPIMSRLKCLEEPSNEAVVERTCQIALDQHFTLSHVVQPEMEELTPAAMVELDHMCQLLWQYLAVHGLFVVLLGGKSSANGACFASVKKKGFVPESKL